MKVRPRFWTLGRVNRLVTVLDQIAFQESGKWYFGPEGLQNAVWYFSCRNRNNFGDFATAGTTQILHGMKILVFLEVIAPGKPGTKSPGYRREYHRERLDRVTQDGLDRYFASLRR